MSLPVTWGYGYESFDGALAGEAILVELTSEPEILIACAMDETNISIDVDSDEVEVIIT